ncbi:MAG: ATP-dependent DNA helicase RecG, partial [Patescibacteria group bacterium]
MPMLKVDTPLSEIHGIGPKFLKTLGRIGVRTVRDLLWHFPSRYEDFSRIYQIAELEPGQQATIQGTIQTVDMRRSFRRRMTIIEALIEDGTGTIRAVWFNQPYLKTTLRPGRLANFSGKVALTENELYLSHPTHEFLGRAETRHTGRLVPIYPETKGLTSRGLRFLLQPILRAAELPQEWIPEEILETEGFPALPEALQNIHFPEKLEDALAAKRRFAFEDLFLLQLLNLEQKSKLARERAFSITADIELLKKLVAALPFALTQSQKQSLWEIVQDIGKPHPMNRLLQGDVGSGKTVVAALASLLAARAGYQSAFMAPTEVLARQHFETLKKTFTRFGNIIALPPVGLLTASGARLFYDDGVETETKKDACVKHIANGKVHIAVGTHALIQETVRFSNLGLVIVDEQHRFGVAQRAKLLRNHEYTPHLLSMSATPIPRTLMLTVFGDLDISTITELPTGRKKIITKIVAPENRAKAYQFIRDEIKKGRQAFVICPRIEPPSQTGTDTISINQHNPYKSALPWETKAVKEEYEKLSQAIFPDLKIGMLHGQLKPKEKEKIMREFQEKKIDILVSTSVVEVGVDVPNATVMMIEGSDRFGLAQLYQFRGRVGRGEHQSYCLLFTDSDSSAECRSLPVRQAGSSGGKTAHARLKAIAEAKNGFELAEMDLKLRGPGQFLGTEQ